MLHISHGVTVVWSPNKEIHVERIYYNQDFIMQAVAKARTFYFDVFLPSIVPCMLIRTSNSHNEYTNCHINKNVEERHIQLYRNSTNYTNPHASTSLRSDMDPSYASDTNDMTPLGVIPIKTLTAFLFLYDENVDDCDTSDDGRPIKNSVASMMILVLG